jgi:aspartyl/asparaginyl beta-hydroxylase (cupin superfamily)
MASQAPTANAAALAQLAREARNRGDAAAEAAAIERLLAVDARNIPALIRRADLYAAAGDARSASSFYLMAIRLAPPSGLPKELAADLARAKQACDRFAGEYRDHMLRGLAARGFDPARSRARFADSVDLILGEKRLFLQQPKYYYFPGLPQVQFYDRALFPWFDELEAATGDIRAELEAVLEEPGAFSPYVTGHANRPKKDEDGMLNNPAWSAHYLWKNGEPVAENVARFPKTMAALRNAPLALVPNRSPSILFSLLRPGAHIPPHNGLVNTRLICHLPVIVPAKCRFRVGNDTRDWVAGKGWAFDDSIEHEAWNGSDRTRVILLFDVWRPELTEEERRLVVSLFETIDAHNGRKPDWEI